MEKKKPIVRTKSEKNSAQRARTRQNKINAIKKAMLTAGGSHLQKLEKDLAKWENQK